MNKQHVAGNFVLQLSKSKAELYYNGTLFLNNCDDIIKLTLEIGLEDFKMLEKLDLEDEEEEIEWLEKMLNKHVLNGDFCVRK